jgi:hypothetical protein
MNEAVKERTWEDEIVELGKNGVLKAEDVVEFAKDPETALHKRFTWDDEECGKQHRLWQARELIRAVVVVIPNVNKEVRAYVSLMEDRGQEGGGYRHIVSVLSDEQQRRRLLAQALVEFDRWKDKYESLKELAAIFEARGKL